MESEAWVIESASPAASSQVRLTPGMSIYVHADVTGLAEGEVWTALGTDATALLEIIRLPAAVGDGFVARTSVGEEVVWEEVEIDFHARVSAHVIEIWLNGDAMGSFLRQENVTIGGLVAESVDVRISREATADAIGNPEYTFPEASALPRDLAEVKLHKGSAKIKRGGDWVSRQAAFDDVVTRLRRDKGALPLEKVVFVDWQEGDDSLDGKSSQPMPGIGKGPKRTWSEALKVLPPDGIVILHGDGGIYKSHANPAEVPPNLTIICIGDVTFVPPTSASNQPVN